MILWSRMPFQLLANLITPISNNIAPLSYAQMKCSDNSLSNPSCSHMLQCILLCDNIRHFSVHVENVGVVYCFAPVTTRSADNLRNTCLASATAVSIPLHLEIRTMGR